MTFIDIAADVIETLGADLEGLGEQILQQLRDRNEARIPVESSAIQELYYRRDNTLSIVFKDGRRYAIENFPPIELSRWLASASIGAYWNAHIRGKY